MARDAAGGVEGASSRPGIGGSCNNFWPTDPAPTALEGPRADIGGTPHNGEPGATTKAVGNGFALGRSPSLPRGQQEQGGGQEFGQHRVVGHAVPSGGTIG